MVKVTPIQTPALRVGTGPVVFRFIAPFKTVEGDTRARGALVETVFEDGGAVKSCNFKSESPLCDLIGNEKLAADLEQYAPGGKYVNRCFLLKGTGKRLRWRGRQLNEILVSEVK
jgi:hypothetical protein